LKHRSLVIAIAVACIEPVEPAVAGSLNTTLNVGCPASAAAGTAINMSLGLVNNEPTGLSVRVISGFAGNANGTLGGLGIYGPQIITETVVNALSTSNVVVPAPPALPPALVGSVATYVVIAEWQGGVDTNIDACLVNVQAQ